MAKLPKDVKNKAVEKAKELGIELGGCGNPHENIRFVPTTMFDHDKLHYEQCGQGFAFVDADGEPHTMTHFHTGKYVTGKDENDPKTEIVLAPLHNATTKHGQITLPDKPEKCSDLAGILKEIEDKLEKWMFIGPEELPIFKVQIRIGIASWFLFVYDPITIQERVAGLNGIVGTSGAGKRRWLTCLRQFTYRPIYLLNTNKIPSVFRMAEPWGTPTLLIDEADQKETGSEAEWVQFINARYDGTPIPRYNASTGQTDIFRSFGLTCLVLRRMPKDEGTTSRMTKINATISPYALPEVAGDDIFQEFESIRNKLFYLRLKYFGKLKFVGSSGLPAEHSWRGKEVLTLFRVLEQIDSEISKDIENISKALTEREVQNLAQTWDGLIINEIYSLITDETAAFERRQNGHFYYKKWTDKDGKAHVSYLNLKYLADRLGTSASDIQRSMAQFKISTYERFRPEENNRAQRGILKFAFPEDTDRIFIRYVPEYNHELLHLIEGQGKLTDLNPGDRSASVPAVPLVPPHDIPNDHDHDHEPYIHVAGTSGTSGTRETEQKISGGISNTQVQHEERPIPSGTVSEGQNSGSLNTQIPENQKNDQKSKVIGEPVNSNAHGKKPTWQEYGDNTVTLVKHEGYTVVMYGNDLIEGHYCILIDKPVDPMKQSDLIDLMRSNGFTYSSEGRDEGLPMWFTLPRVNDEFLAGGGYN